MKLYVIISHIEKERSGFLNTKKLAESLFEKGLEYKRKGNLDEMIKSFYEGIANDPENEKIHYELGKALFLKGEYGPSLNAYLSYTHLKVRKRELSLRGDLEFEENEKESVEHYYNNLPKEIVDSLPRKSAAYILEDGDICNHAAHSFFGAGEITEKEIIENFKLYYATLVSPHLVEITLEQYGFSLEEFQKLNIELFIPKGRMILLDNLAWDKIEESDVVKIYFE